MNGYDHYGRNGFHPTNSGDPFNHRDDPYDRNEFGRSHRNGYGPDIVDRSSFDGRFDSRDMRENEFELDHLATFSSRTGPMSAEDGLRKLRQMESSTGIWTMRCVMIVDKQTSTLLIIDKGNGEELERFPIESVHEPTAIFKDDKREIYTNLILFTVVDDFRRRNGPADMHIFQSIISPAQEIVDEIQASKDGRPSSSFGQKIPPPPMGPAPNPPRFGEDYRQTRTGGGFGQSNRASYMPTDMDSGQNEILERDVQLLNACFDDIEKFVSRLQQAAEAYKELERRRKDRNNKKSKTSRQSGDGMLNMRAKPPPADDFIDIFEKFKFAFNLLAKLKAHIHDPNAPELVHFLFTPLSLIYEASRDPVHGGRDLAESATRPAITQDAKQLLLNCLTSKELELWQSLGKSWTNSRDNYGDTYMPRFYNGWAPAMSAPVDRLDRSRMEDALMNHERQIRDRDIEDRVRREGGELVMPFPPTRDEDRNYIGRSTRYDQYSRPPEDNYARNREVHEPRMSEPRPMSRQDKNIQFAQDILRSNGKVMEAVHDRQGRNNKEITVEKGDLLQVLDDSRNWWKLKNHEGHIGYAPYTILKEYAVSDMEMDKTRGRRSSGEYNSHIQTNGAPAPPAPPPPPSGSRRQDDIDDKKQRKSSSRRQRHSEDYSSGSASDDERQSRGRRSDRAHSSRSPRDDSDGWSRDSSDREQTSYRSNRQSDKRRQRSPPSKYSDPPTPRYDDPPRKYRDPSPRRKDPPPPPASRPPPARGQRITTDKKRDDLHDELQQRMSRGPKSGQGPKTAQKPQRERPQVKNITARSSVDDVGDWLDTKGFSEECIHVFRRYNGEDMFRLKRKEMDRLIGTQEAQRLESQILVQKNKEGYKTARSGGKELQAILHRRKEMADRKGGDNPAFAPESPDYSDSESDASDNMENVGLTLRAMLRHQRKRISNSVYHD